MINRAHELPITRHAELTLGLNRMRTSTLGLLISRRFVFPADVVVDDESGTATPKIHHRPCDPEVRGWANRR
jgi:hypothetical protein